MNIIFLDVDGVLNSIRGLKETYFQTKRPYSGYDYPFDVRCMYNLKKIVDMTDSYLVITSTWRKDEIGKNILLEELKRYGLDERVIGYTDILHKKRGEEIKAYLEKLGREVNYIILDDDSDFDELMNHLVKTNFQTGLNDESVEKSIKILSKDKD